jgi:hypothetical protein
MNHSTAMSDMPLSTSPDNFPYPIQPFLYPNILKPTCIIKYVTELPIPTRLIPKCNNGYEYYEIEMRETLTQFPILFGY